MLEFHHVTPFAVGGATTVENLQLRCRSHNAHEADVFFGSDTDSVRTELLENADVLSPAGRTEPLVCSEPIR